MSEAKVEMKARVINQDTGEQQEVSLVTETRFATDVRLELRRARGAADEGKPFPPINSLHEGYAVLKEEVDEFWQEVMKKRKDRSKAALYKELVQVAAMAQRTAEDVLLNRAAVTPTDPPGESSP